MKTISLNKYCSLNWILFCCTGYNGDSLPSYHPFPRVSQLRWLFVPDIKRKWRRQRKRGWKCGQYWSLSGSSNTSRVLSILSSLCCRSLRLKSQLHLWRISEGFWKYIGCILRACKLSVEMYRFTIAERFCVLRKDNWAKDSSVAQRMHFEANSWLGL